MIRAHGKNHHLGSISSDFSECYVKEDSVSQYSGVCGGLVMSAVEGNQRMMKSTEFYV